MWKGLTRVMAISGEGEEMECTRKQAIEWACLAEAHKHFMQAYNTPLLTKPLLSIFSESGLN